MVNRIIFIITLGNSVLSMHMLKHRKRILGGKRNTILNIVSIEQRPSIINNKERFGDWEIDTIIGENKKGAIVTIVERTTGFLLMKKLEHGKNAKELAKAVIKMLLPYKHMVHSITSDNGTEFAEHQLIAKKLKTNFYFAHPYASWERGINEYILFLNRFTKVKLFRKSYTDRNFLFFYSVSVNQ